MVCEHWSEEELTRPQTCRLVALETFNEFSAVVLSSVGAAGETFPSSAVINRPEHEPQNIIATGDRYLKEPIFTLYGWVFRCHRVLCVVAFRTSLTQQKANCGHEQMLEPSSCSDEEQTQWKGHYIIRAGNFLQPARGDERVRLFSNTLHLKSPARVDHTFSSFSSIQIFICCKQKYKEKLKPDGFSICICLLSVVGLCEFRT